MENKKKAQNALKRIKPLAFFLMLALTLLVLVGTTLAVIVTKTPTLHNLFVSGVSPTGDLVIHKIVEHPFGENYTVPDNDHTSFSFTVELGAGNAGKTFGDYTADDRGVVTLTIKAGDMVSLTGIPTGTEVTVRETGGGSGFSVQDGENEKKITIQRSQVNTLDFTNIYTPSPAPADLTVTGIKTLVGRDWQEGDTFTFRLEQYLDGSWIGLGDESITCRYIEQEDSDRPGETVKVVDPSSLSFDFGSQIGMAAFDTAGVYSFRVTEVEGNVGGITYDKTESYFDVLVGDADMDGALEIQNVSSVSGNTDIDGKAVAIHFENHYAPAGSAEVIIEIEKLFEDTSGQNRMPEGFVFELYRENGELAAVSEATSAAGETEIRMVFTPEAAGVTEAYILKEIHGGETIDGVQYDSAEIKLYISVVDNLDGTVSAYIYDDDSLVSVFEGYISTEPDQAETGEGEPPEGTEDEPNSEEAADFTEEKEQETEETETTAAADFVSETAETEAESTETEGTETESTEAESAKQEGTEAESAEHEGAENEGAETEGAVTGGQIDWQRLPDMEESLGMLSIPPEVTNRYAAVFINIYDPENAGETIVGVKKLSGREIRADEFWFCLYETKADFVIPLGTEPTDRVSCQSDGSIAFHTLEFDKVGTYYYVVTEDNSNPLGGVTYDDESYFVTIQVTDGGGALMAKTSITDEYGKESQIVFSNSYAPAKAILRLDGIKTVTGYQMSEGDFTFDLYCAGEDFTIDGTAIQSVRNHADGSFAFEELDFTAAGIYRYIVKENASDPKAGILYDTTEYHITVTVEDDERGTLAAAVSMVRSKGSETGTADVILFENDYSAEYAVLTLGGTKILQGATLGQGQFTFLLFAADDSFVPQGEPIRRAVNSANGSITFDALTYGEEGIYRYVMREDTSQQMPDIHYDGTAYDVTVTVTDDGSGQLAATWTMIREEDGRTVSDAVFENVYTAPIADTSVNITVKKTVNNTGSRSIGPEGFEFVLTDADTGESRTVKSDQNGLSEFALTFTKDDVNKTRRYRLSETAGQMEGVTYSNRVYQFEIAVTTDSEGKLIATVKQDGQIVQQPAAEFVNIYHYAASDHGGPGSSDGSGADTGDSSHLVWWISLMIVSAVGLAVLGIAERKRRRDREKR